MFTIIKDKYIRCFVGLFVFIFLSVATCNSYASVCFLPTGNCGSEDESIKKDDEFVCWPGAEGDCPDKDCPEGYKLSYCPDGSICDEKDGCYKIIGNEPEDKDPCTTTCTKSEGHRTCTTDSKGCPIVDKECLDDKYLTLQACKNGNNGANCKLVGDCYEVDTYVPPSCSSKGEGWYDTCPTGKTCSQASDGCYQVVETNSECPTGKFCIKFNYTCNGRTCTPNFISQLGIYGDMEFYWYPNSTWDGKFEDFSPTNEELDEHIDWGDTIELYDDWVFNTTIDEDGNGFIEGETFYSFDISNIKNKNLLTFNFYVSIYSEDNYPPSFSSTLGKEKIINNIYDQMYFDMYLEDGVWIIYDWNAEKIISKVSAENNLLEVDVDFTRTACSDEITRIAFVAKCVDLTEIDCGEPEGVAYMDDRYNTCLNFNKLGCIDPKLITDKGNISDYDVYQIYGLDDKSDNKTRLLIVKDSDIYEELIWEDNGYQLQYFWWDEDPDDTLSPQDDFVYIFEQAPVCLRYEAEIHPLYKKAYVSNNGDYWLDAREFAFPDDKVHEINMDYSTLDANPKIMKISDHTGNYLYPVTRVDYDYSLKYRKGFAEICVFVNVDSPFNRNDDMSHSKIMWVNDWSPENRTISATYNGHNVSAWPRDYDAWSSGFTALDIVEIEGLGSKYNVNFWEHYTKWGSKYPLSSVFSTTCDGLSNKAFDANSSLEAWTIKGDTFSYKIITDYSGLITNPPKYE